jgi:hypothetical protein
MNITQEGEDQYQIRQEQQNIKSMSKIKQTKIPMTLTGDNVLKIAVEQGVIENEFNWKLVRERDGLTNQSAEVMWLEFDEVGRFKDKYDTPAVGRSLIMSPFSQYFTWQTTTITEIVEERDDYIKFKTQNSNYELWKLNVND